MPKALSCWTNVPLRCCIGTLAVFTVLNLPYRYAELSGVTLGEVSEATPAPGFAASRQSGAICGGWPLRYVSLFGSQDSQATPWPDASWEVGALLANALLALTAAVAAAWLVARSPRMATVAAASGLLLAVLWGGYHAARDLAITNRLLASGSVYRSVVVPVWLTRFAPSAGLQAFSRARGVMLYRVDPEAVSLAVQLPALHSLGFWKGVPTTDQLRPLVLEPRLHQLAIFDAELDEAALPFIATQGELRQLQLIGCRGLSGGLQELAGLPELHTFDATDSDLPLSTLATAPWAQRLRHLSVSHPVSGSETLALRDFHQLESLSIRRRASTLNADPLTLSLHALSRLRTISLVSTQKVSLSIHHAPRLRELRVSESQTQVTALPIEDAPVSFWLEKLCLLDTPRLKKIGCYGLDLKKIELRDTPALHELAIDMVRTDQEPAANQLANCAAQLASLINDLAACDGPPVINLSTLPLEGIDLTPLTKNQRIRELKLARTGITGEQLKSLMSLRRLRKLDVRGCPISSAEVTEVLRSQPQLAQLYVDGKDFRQIEIIDRHHLVKFTSGPSPQASHVRISGSPQLDSELVLGDCVEELSIQDANSLRGISVNGPVPPGATLQGFRELRFCALGGPRVDDRLCASLWQCPQLNHLTLAHSSLSREAIANISRLENLITLILPGCDLDDSVTKHWWELKHLSEVDLSYTKVSTQTLALLLSRRNLQRLALNYVDLEKADLRGLDQVMQLMELEVAGIGLEEDALRTLVARGMIDRLDLSDCVLSPESLEILGSDAADSLVFLGLQNCDLSEAELRSVLGKRHRLAVDIEGNRFSEAFRQELRDSGRLLSRHDRAGFLRRVVQTGPLAAFGDAESLVAAALDNTRGRIDTHRFVVPAAFTASR